MPIKLNTASGGGVILTGANTASDKTITVPAVDATMLTDSSGVLNIGSGQVYKDASGNVGIGTSSPAAPLDVKGVVRFTNSANAANYGEIYDGGGLILKSQNSNPMYFFTSNTERARIDSSGNLLVGTTSNASSNPAKLYVLGDATYLPLGLRVSANGNWAAAFFNASGTAQGNITVNASSVNYNSTSDYRLKENIQPMTGALAKVAALKPCTYTWKATGEAGQGFIAHELAEVVPDAVTGEKDAVNEDGSIKPQGIDTSFLVATLTAALQEQQQMIETLQAKVAALEAKL